MNKYDISLVVILIVVSLGIIFSQTFEKQSIKKAYVYYENKIIKEIDLNSKVKEYKIKGYNGDIFLEAGEGKIRVLEEKSPLHLCSKQGYIEKKHEQIVCLPNKIIIELKNDELDTTLR